MGVNEGFNIYPPSMLAVRASTTTSSKKYCKNTKTPSTPLQVKLSSVLSESREPKTPTYTSNSARAL